MVPCSTLPFPRPLFTMFLGSVSCADPYLAALRMLFDWLVVGHIINVNLIARPFSKSWPSVS